MPKKIINKLLFYEFCNVDKIQIVDLIVANIINPEKSSEKSLSNSLIDLRS